MNNRTVVLLASLAFGIVMSHSVAAELPGVGNPGVFLDKFVKFRAAQLQRQDPQVVVVRMGYVKGLSRSFVAMTGMVMFDLQSGNFRVAMTGLQPGDTYSLWLVEQGNALPVSDYQDARAVKLMDVNSTLPSFRSSGRLDKVALAGFKMDQVVLAQGSANLNTIIAAGSLGVMDKLFYAGGNVLATALTSPVLPFSFMIPAAFDPSTIGSTVTTTGSTSTSTALTSTASSSSTGTPLDVLIAQGERLFLDATFSGNGRTCGSCHPATHNFTIDKDFIATLPADDPLFVAEFNPDLAELERPALMREFGLILENVDGLEDPTHKFVMRGVPHTLGLQVSITPDTKLGNPPAAMLGWSGDGAAGTGSLREFAIGAITQHFTKSLARVAGQDFILPNNQQLDAMEAFQLSLGRSADYDLSKLTFLDPNVATGQDLFINGTGDPNAGGRCSACHGNAGALAGNGQNRNFNTHVEDVPHPAHAIEIYPHDGGFGKAPNADGTFGDQTFNTASVVEAADTAPFFHNNVAQTLEDVLAFYNSTVFNDPRAPGAKISFTPDQIIDVVKFLRAINVVQNVQEARRELTEILALTGNPQPQVQSRLTLAQSDSSDAIRVLNEGGIYINDALPQVTSAQQLISQAQQTANPNARDSLISQAITALNNSQQLIVSIVP